MEEDLEDLLTWIADAPHARLKAAWGEHCTGWVLPKKTSVQFLRMALAWKAQERVFGGLPLEVLALINGKTEKKKPGDQILAGTVLRRTWRGDLYEVMVLEKGFSFDGATYGSLSEIARVITGTRWNGPAFFGLRQQKKRQADQAHPEAAS